MRQAALFTCAHCSAQFTSRHLLLTHILLHPCDDDGERAEDLETASIASYDEDDEDDEDDSHRIFSPVSTAVESTSFRSSSFPPPSPPPDALSDFISHGGENGDANGADGDGDDDGDDAMSVLLDSDVEAVRERKRPHVCPVPDCGKRFRTPSHLAQHEKVHQDPTTPTHTCPHCPMSFRTPSILHAHVRASHPPVCVICTRTFASRDGLRRHVATHEGEKRRERWRCEVEGCGRGYVTKKLLNLHVRSTHETPNAHECPVCTKRFTLASSLRRHVLLHQGVRPQAKPKTPPPPVDLIALLAGAPLIDPLRKIPCPVAAPTGCTLTFRRDYDATRHAKAFHPDEWASFEAATAGAEDGEGEGAASGSGSGSGSGAAEKEKAFECGVCGQVFTRRWDRLRHGRAKHKDATEEEVVGAAA
ncbi:hypothetical protein M427DRAFT_59383 [Gonapodya prolifera JEL478]|uniref:C2H2-type domain-containing protein n=1 Tax=Gonapodya prolifera (strain JEL478) TaxID=1344416 RepID=A0A139A790_GONPJ|nr:hypothetical protein M427DRAFT_59383 [Gonapodya prolifera JEL478]|eukprot:KXS12647.1 hypothetical protein M427DRAFT_59383 [Gonapodya prolifera JEL478]